MIGVIVGPWVTESGELASSRLGDRHLSSCIPADRLGSSRRAVAVVQDFYDNTTDDAYKMRYDYREA